MTELIGATLCSGIGAPECAAPWIQWAWHAEIEPFPAAVHAARFPGSVNLGDMTASDFVERAARIALPDVIVAGTPCQAFSVAGARGSLADARGNLTLLFVRLANAIDDLRRAAGRAPAWIVWENVPGVLSVSDNALGAFLGGLVGSDAAVEPPPGRGWTDAGVVHGPRRCAAWRVLDAQHFGVAQRRRRVFVLARGGAGAWSAADALLPVIETMRWHPAPSRAAGERPAPSLAARTRGGGGLGTDTELDGGLIPAVSPTLRAGGNRTGGDRPPGTDVDTADSLIPLGLGDDGQIARALNACRTASGRHDASVDTFVAHALRGEGLDASEDGTGRGTPLVPVHAFDARQSDVIQYGDRTGPLDTDGHSVAVAFSAKDHGADAGHLASTLRAMGHGASHANGGGQVAVATAMQVRRLTPRECERLQGFPDDWTAIPWRGRPAAECPDGPRYKALGNSMAVPVLRYLLERVRDVDAEAPR